MLLALRESPCRLCLRSDVNTKSKDATYDTCWRTSIEISRLGSLDRRNGHFYRYRLDVVSDGSLGVPGLSMEMGY